MKTKIVYLFLIGCTLLLSSFISYRPGSNPDAILGEWLVGSQKGKVEIYKKGEKYYGKIIWLKEPLQANGKPKVDANNPEPSKKSQPIMGLNMLSDFKYVGDNNWEDGTIYDPENGKEYSCNLTLKDKNTLDVRGYIGFSWIGRTDTWKRVN